MGYCREHRSRSPKRSIGEGKGMEIDIETEVQKLKAEVDELAAQLNQLDAQIGQLQQQRNDLVSQALRKAGFLEGLLRLKGNSENP